MRENDQSRIAKIGLRLALTLVAWALCALAFGPLYRIVGPVASVLTISPVMVTGWFFGVWAGVIAGIIAFPVNVLLLDGVGGDGWRLLTQNGLPGTVLIILVGAVAGRLHSLGARMRQELAGRQQVEEALQRRYREMNLLNRASRMIGATLDLDQVLATILEEVRNLMNLVACSVWLVDPVSHELVCRQATGPHSDIVRGWRLSSGEGLAGWVAQNGESMIVSDALADKRHARSVGQQTGLTTRSILSVPLMVKQRVIGVLQVMDEGVDRFGSGDLRLLEPLATSAAIAIDNARLVDTLRHRTVELEARNDELTRFTYVASHNLRAPLVNLQGFVGELHHTLETMAPAITSSLPQLDEEQRHIIVTAVEEDIPEALGFIDSSVDVMNRLNNALLELSNMSRRTLVIEPVDMNGLVQEILEGLTFLVAERQAKVTVSELPSVVADRIAMKRIMENLLRNALLYLDADRPGEIEVGAENNNSEAIFHVCDNGRGIAEDDMDKVFTPFRRAGRSQEPGEGMGLAYVQTLVRRHGGRIWCESGLGMGTTFTFTVSNHSTKGNSLV